jgi:O-antigen ligase
VSSVAARETLPGRVGHAAMPLLLGGGALAAGAIVTALATKVGGDQAPWVLLALALGPVIMAGVVANRLVGPLLVLALFPIGSIHLPTPGLSLQVVELAVFVVTMLVVLRRLGSGLRPLSWAPPLWWAVGLLCWSLIATMSTLDVALSINQDAALAGGIIFAAVVLSTLRDTDDVRAFLGVLLTVGFGLAIFGLSQRGQFQSVSAGETVSGRLQGAFDHPNQLGMFSALCAMFATGLALGARTKTARILAGLALPFILLALIFSLSRGAWIGTGVGFLYLLFVLREARRALVLVAIPFVILGSLFGSFAPGTTDTTQVVTMRAQAITTLSPYDGRPAIYAEAIREIKADPLTGVGPGAFPASSQRAGSSAISVFADHAHNLWLTWGAETGFPGVALIIILTLSLGIAAYRAGRLASSGDRRDRAVLAGLTAALIAVLGQGIFDYLLRNAVLWICVWGLIGALLVCVRSYGVFGANAPEVTP